ncbi:hypothetical protein AOQ84DRAFT_174027 [Glonium stellatum]|uniref:Uncharacterized protein n=1 Tax=Glonium stellatum TaxID=574774 RepID=A0A8E2F7G2_9PEZI|nr:hypothetical protein AOQ84DRAFT_174027 [Glonium stellatum]
MPVPDSRRSCAGGPSTPCFDKFKGGCRPEGFQQSTPIASSVSWGTSNRPQKERIKSRVDLFRCMPRRAPSFTSTLQVARGHADDLRSSHPTSRLRTPCTPAHPAPPLSPSWAVIAIISRDAAANPLLPGLARKNPPLLKLRAPYHKTAPRATTLSELRALLSTEVGLQNPAKPPVYTAMAMRG